MNTYQQLDAWVDAHFDQQVTFLQQLIRVPTDTPPGDNAPHAERTAELLKGFGLEAEQYPVPQSELHACGLASITNLLVRRKYGSGGRTVLLNAHGDVVPPGEGWTKDPYGGEIENGKIYGRAAAVSKCDFSTYTFALRALEAVARPARGSVELLFTYDEEFGGEVGPAWLLKHKIIHPDLMIAAGFSYQVITAHNGCLQMEVTVHGKMAHAAIPDSGVDAMQAAVAILNALYAQNAVYKTIMDPDLTLPYVAATIKKSIDAYKGIAGFDISGNPGVTSTLYNIGNPEQHAYELKLENDRRRTAGEPVKLPEENYYGWLVNDKLSELKALF